MTADIPEDILGALAYRGRSAQSPVFSISECSRDSLAVEVLIPEKQVVTLVDRYEAVSSERRDIRKLMSFFHGVALEGEPSLRLPRNICLQCPRMIEGERTLHY